MTIKEQCKIDKTGINIKVSEYFEKNLAKMIKVLTKKRKERLCLK